MYNNTYNIFMISTLKIHYGVIALYNLTYVNYCFVMQWFKHCIIDFHFNKTQLKNHNITLIDSH